MPPSSLLSTAVRTADAKRGRRAGGASESSNNGSKAVFEVLDGSERHRGGPSLWRLSADRARLAAALCEPRLRRARRPKLEALELVRTRCRSLSRRASSPCDASTPPGALTGSPMRSAPRTRRPRTLVHLSGPSSATAWSRRHRGSGGVVTNKRWERSAPMELWQMMTSWAASISAGGTECKVLTGVDDHSRFCVCARLVVRATATPVRGALSWAIRTHGAPEQLLTDNRQGLYSIASVPGPTGALRPPLPRARHPPHLDGPPTRPPRRARWERFHKTLRAEFLTEHDRMHPSIGRAPGRSRRLGRDLQHRAPAPEPRQLPSG